MSHHLDKRPNSGARQKTRGDTCLNIATKSDVKNNQMRCLFRNLRCLVSRNFLQSAES